MAFLDRLLRLIKMDRASRSTRRFRRNYARRTRYPELTREILESITEMEFDSAVVDYVHLKVGTGGRRRALEIISQMSRGIQAVYATWWVQGERDNGGLHQYFYNQGVEFAFMALEGYRLLGARKHAEMMARAIDAYLEEEESQRAHYSGEVTTMVEDYVEATKGSSLPALERMCDTTGENVIVLAFQYMKSHPEEFVTR